MNHSDVMGTPHKPHAPVLLRHLAPAEQPVVQAQHLKRPSCSLEAARYDLLSCGIVRQIFRSSSSLFLSFTDKATTLQVPPTAKYSVIM